MHCWIFSSKPTGIYKRSTASILFLHVLAENATKGWGAGTTLEKTTQLTIRDPDIFSAERGTTHGAYLSVEEAEYCGHQ